MSEVSAGVFATARRGGLDAYEREFIRQKRAQRVPVSAIAHMLGRSTTVIRDFIDAAETSPVSAVLTDRQPAVPPDAAAEVIARVAQRHGLHPDDLTGRSMRSPAIAARQEAYAVLRAMTQAGVLRWSAAQIGAWFGRDHSTVLTGASAYHRRASEGPRVRPFTGGAP